MLKMIGDTGKNAVRREMPRQCHGLHGCTRNDNCLACKQAVNIAALEKAAANIRDYHEQMAHTRTGEPARRSSSRKASVRRRT